MIEWLLPDVEGDAELGKLTRHHAIKHRADSRLLNGLHLYGAFPHLHGAHKALYKASHSPICAHTPGCLVVGELTGGGSISDF